MKKLFALAVLLFSALAFCCTPKETPIARVIAPAPDVVEVHSWREYELELHVDVDFNDSTRAMINEAAMRWRRASLGHVRLTPIFDVNFESTLSVVEHMNARHALVIGVPETNPMALEIDFGHPRQHPLAATGTIGKTGARIVILITDRIPPKNFDEVVTHEFGHVFGLPDLPLLGSVMSGADIAGFPVPHELTPADVELCRSYRFCP